MKSLKTEIIINAPAKKVWQILMDFGAYAEWNPFIRSVKGKAEVGSQLVNTLHLEGQKPQVFKPTVLEVKEEQSFQWLGHLFVKGLFDGNHYFKLETIAPNKTRFIHGENFSGLLVSPIMKMIGQSTLQGFEKMNVALKERAEG